MTTSLWQAVRIDHGLYAGAPPVTPLPAGAVAPLALAQERFWIAHQAAPSSAHNLRTMLHLAGPLAVPMLERALDGVVQRHAVLRSCCALEGVTPRQRTSSHEPVTLAAEPIRGGLAAARAVAAGVATETFNLEKAPLWRARLLQLAPDEHVLVWVTHHIVFDGWSRSLVQRELAGLYTSLCRGETPAVPALTVQYADFAHWQRNWVVGERLERQKQYWTYRLRGPLTPLAGATAAGRADEGGREWLALEADLADALRKFSRERGVSLFVTLLAAVHALFHKYTGSRDSLVCVPVAGRHRRETRRLVGCFSNVVPLRTDLSGDPTLLELVMRVSAAQLDTLPFQDFPFHWLAALPGVDASVLRHALFALESLPGTPDEMNGVRIGSPVPEREATDFDFFLLVKELDDGLHAAVSSRHGLFAPADARQLLSDYRIVLAELAANPDRRLSGLAPGTAIARANARGTARVSHVSDTQPATRVERRLRTRWRRMLGHAVGVEESFFECGGHSLLALQLLAEVQREFGREIPLAAFMREPTVRGLARLLQDPRLPVAQTEVQFNAGVGAGAPTLFFVPGGGGSEAELQFVYAPMLASLPWPVTGLVARRDPRGQESVAGMARRLAARIRSLQPAGPYRLAGECLGGFLALEVAHELHRTGGEVAHLVLLDTHVPGERASAPSRRRPPRSAWSAISGRLHAHREGLRGQSPRRWGAHLTRALASLPRFLCQTRTSQATQRARRAHEEVLRGWRPASVWHGHVTLIVPEERAPAATRDAWMRWADSVELVTVPGDHHSYLREHVATTTAALSGCLDRSSRPGLR